MAVRYFWAKASFSIPETIYDYVQRGSSLLLDDGKILLEVLENFGDCLNCEVKRGGTLLSEKSIAVPDSTLRPPTLTESDLENLSLAAACGVSGVMQPFVRDVQDLVALRQALTDAGAEHVRIYAKLENRQASLLCRSFWTMRMCLSLPGAIWAMMCRCGSFLRCRSGAGSIFAGGRKAIRHRDPDAGFHGASAGAHPGRGVRYFQCRAGRGGAVMLTARRLRENIQGTGQEYLVENGEQA